VQSLFLFRRRAPATEIVRPGLAQTSQLQPLQFGTRRFYQMSEYLFHKRSWLAGSKSSKLRVAGWSLPKCAPSPLTATSSCHTDHAAISQNAPPISSIQICPSSFWCSPLPSPVNGHFRQGIGQDAKRTTGPCMLGAPVPKWLLNQPRERHSITGCPSWFKPLLPGQSASVGREPAWKSDLMLTPPRNAGAGPPVE